MKYSMVLIALTVLSFSACRKETGVQPAGVTSETVPALMKKGPKPFKGTMVYEPTTTFNLPCNCGSFIDFGTLTGTGNLTHLGLTTSDIKPCIVFTATGFHVGVECGSFVAANGDQLYTTVNPYDLYYTPAGFTGTLHVDFNGGTGKFSGATGGFDATLQIDFSNIATLHITSGSINY